MAKKQMPRRTGDCYKVSGEFAINLFFARKPEELAGWYVVHGVVTGTGGEAVGLRYGHGWIEQDVDQRFTLVHEKSNGHDMVIPKPLYYAVGSVEPEHTTRFTIPEYVKRMNETGYYGPLVEYPEGVL